MKYYKICYPDEHNNPIEETLSEQDILDFYWEYWYEVMVRADKRDLISLDRCIEDFIAINWAEELDEKYIENYK